MFQFAWWSIKKLKGKIFPRRQLIEVLNPTFSVPWAWGYLARIFLSPGRRKVVVQVRRMEQVLTKEFHQYHYNDNSSQKYHRLSSMDVLASDNTTVKSLSVKLLFIMWSKPCTLQLRLGFHSNFRLLTEKMYDKESATSNSAGVIQTLTKFCYLWCLTDQTIDIGFLDFFNRLPKKSPATGTLRLFQRVNAGDTFYAAYGPDALFVAQHVFHTKSVVKYLGAGARRLESVTLKVSVAQTLLREALTSKQLRVEIYEPEGGQGKKSPNFELTKQVRVAALFGPLYYNNDLFSLSF